MMIWIVVQAIINILMGLAIFMMWTLLKRPPKDDPRLSRGLQLLQSKISILEDLSDRTEVQVKQLTSLLDKKTIMLQDKIQAANVQNQKVEDSMNRSLEVAEIFQDKIPHGEIIDRQEKRKYIQAAQMAHSGVAIEEIIAQTGLPQAQVEFISKVNKDELMFDENQLPAWAVHQSGESVLPDGLGLSEVFEESPASIDYESLDKLGVSFREACVKFEEEQKNLDHEIENSLPNKMSKKAEELSHQMGDKISQGLTQSREVIAEQSEKLGHKMKQGGESLASKVKQGSDVITAKVREGSEKITSAGTDLMDKAAQKVENKTFTSSIEIIESEDMDNVKTDEIKKADFPRV